MDPFLSNLRNVKSNIANRTQLSSASRQNIQPIGSKYLIPNKKECVQCIIGFLGSMDFHPCSAKDLLRSPPLQTLLDIWNFLFRMVDATANITKENMASEVPKFFKEFGYPHIMKTSHLRTPTADHQWESNLVALSWLCKLLLYERECFDKPFTHNAKTIGEGSLGTNVRAHGKASIANNGVAQFVTDQATKHYQLYLQGEENSMQLMQDFENTIEDLLVKLQVSVDKKAEALEELRANTLELQEELEGFARIKEWIKKANVELKRIEELTQSLQTSCLQAEEQLKHYRDTLKKEELGLEEQEQRKTELENLIEAQNINRNALNDLNQAINALKARISENNRKIKELEQDIPQAESSAHSMELELISSQNSLASTRESIKNFLINNGSYAESWTNLEHIRVNVSGMHEVEILGISPTAYDHVVNEIISKDCDRMRLSKETRVELEEGNKELENLLNTLTSQTSDILREASTLFKAHVLEETESELQKETHRLAEAIRQAARDELEQAKRELEAVESSILEAKNNLKEQDSEAQQAWQNMINRLRKIYNNAKTSKESNRRELRKIIDMEKSMLQADQTSSENRPN